ncbi:MAG: OmpH family outer membrane protein [Polyangiales bacterium]
MRSLRLFFVAAALAVPAFALVPSDAEAQATMSVVYVDIDRVINDCDEGKEAQELLKKEQAKRQTDIQAREAEIKKLQDELEKQAKAFSAAAIEKKAATYQQAVIDYQNVVLKYQKELDSREKELFDPIERRIKALLRDVALRDGYDMILNKRSVPYGRKDLDVTDKVTQEYNKLYPVSKKPEKKPDDKKKKPAPAPSVAPKMQ